MVPVPLHRRGGIGHGNYTFPTCQLNPFIYVIDYWELQLSCYN